MGGQGNRMGGPMGGPSPGIDIMSSPARINSPGPRRPFGQFSNLPRFPHMQSPGGMRPVFFNSDSSDSDQAGMGDGDRRLAAEPKEWPPDDDVNAEDELDEDLPIDSDERMLLLREHPRMARLGVPNLGVLGAPFGPRGPMLPGQGPQNPMLGMPRPQSPNTGLPSLLSVRMMPPAQQQQQQVLTVPDGPAPGFALAPGGVRLPLSAVGVRSGLMPPSASPHLLPPTTGPHLPMGVNVNGSVIVTRPGLPPSSVGGTDSPDAISDMPSSEEDMMRPRVPGPLPFMQIPGGSHPPPGGPVLGRGFAPMTIRPRGGPGLLGLRPGVQGGGGFNRFRGPRPLMGPLFGGMDRPVFGNRFGLPIRPPVGFIDQDEWDIRDDRRLPPRIELEDHLRAKNVGDQNQVNDINERRESPASQVGQEVGVQQSVNEQSKPGRASGRASRWHDGTSNPESLLDSQSAAAPAGSVNQSEAASPQLQQSEAEKETPVPVEAQPAAAASGSDTPTASNQIQSADPKNDDAAVNSGSDSEVNPLPAVTNSSEETTS